jgi:hypothetical protein
MMKATTICALLVATNAVHPTVSQDYDPVMGRYPGSIIPGADPIMPKPSAPIDGTFVSLDIQAEQRSEVRSTLKQQLRAFLESEKNVPQDSLIFLGDEDDTVEGARQQAAMMQAQLDQAVADADKKREEQEKAFAMQDSNDPAAQLQGLMNAQASLHRLTANFSNKPNLDKVTGMAQKLGIPMTPELMQLGSNEAISNALVEIAVGMGKSEAEIGKALGPDM